MLPNDEDDPDAGWHEAKKSEIVKHFKETYEEERGKMEGSSSEESEEVESSSEEEEVVASSKKRSSGRRSTSDSPKRTSKKVTTTTIHIAPDGSRTVETMVGGSAAGVAAATAVPVGMPRSSGYRMIKTATMYLPPSGSGEKARVSESVTPISQCSSEVIAGITQAPSGGSGGPPTHSKSSTYTANTTDSNLNPSIINNVYGRSIFQVPNSHNRLVAEAEHYDFAPESCIFCICCVADQIRARTYARVYENRLETNYPFSPWCCFTPEYCLVDRVMVYYFDKGPSQTYCGILGSRLDCCAPILGPPVVFTHVPRMCCNTIDLRPCFGETLNAAPCQCCGLRVFCCIGRPCYEYCSCPIAGPIKNGRDFLEKYRGALDDYTQIRPVQRHTMFTRVSERPCGCDKVTLINPYPIDISFANYREKLLLIPEAIPSPLIMDRD